MTTAALLAMLKRMKSLGQETTEASSIAGDELLCVLRAGNLLFGVDATSLLYEDTDGFVTAPPAPLPCAPPAVLGIVQVRGRIYTVIDFAQVMAAHKSADTLQSPTTAEAALRVFPLRGREQLALAAERVELKVNINTSHIEISDAKLPAVRGVVRSIAGQDVLLLDLGELFAAATQGMERRRRRT